MLVALVREGHAVLETLVTYWATLAYWLATGAGIQSPWPRKYLNTPQLVHVYSCAQMLRTWNHPHYRERTFGIDVSRNLANVAIPGTGVPLSVFCVHRLVFAAFLFLVYPLAALAAALVGAWRGDVATASGEFAVQLLAPDHWFALWRLNCTLAACHAEVSRAVGQYALEDKATFLLEGAKQGVPVSPYLLMDGIVVKHKSIEGGMGIHTFRSFTHGGDWILQQALHNAEPLARLLPPSAPLSTLRVVTSSERWISEQQRLRAAAGPPVADLGPPPPPPRHLRLRTPSVAGEGDEAAALHGGAGASPLANGAACSPAHSHSPARVGGGWGNGTFFGNGVGGSGAAYAGAQTVGIGVVTAVWRAGLAGAATDHCSICVPVDVPSGRLGSGVSSQHWYRLGWAAVGRLPTEARVRYSFHPQSGTNVAGEHVPEFGAVCDLVVATHAALLPDVPLVGWDVALTPEGACLLEVNLSCNLFGGSFDREAYYALCQRLFAAMDAAQARSEW